MTRSEVLDAAKQIITEDRNSPYGEPEESFANIANLWNVYWGEERRFTPHDVAMFCILLKVARLMKTPDHLDSILDVVGYAACAGGMIGTTEPPSTYAKIVDGGAASFNWTPEREEGGG